MLVACSPETVPPLPLCLPISVITPKTVGLSDEQIKAGQAKYGPNELPEEEGATIWELFLEQFDDPLVKILLAAAVISFVSLLLVRTKRGMKGREGHTQRQRATRGKGERTCRRNLCWDTLLNST